MVNKNYGFLKKLQRLVKYKLFIPMKRVKLSPVVKARGVAVGVAWAMTPLIGVQMWFVFFTWIIARKMFKFDFSLVLGLAWTWITNVVTMIPVYYLFYITGLFLRGVNIDNSAYVMLKKVVKDNFMGDLSFMDKWTLIFKIIFQDWGVSMVIGCIPWSIFTTILAYKLTLKYSKPKVSCNFQK